MAKENQQQSQLTKRAREAVERLNKLSPKAQLAILLVIKEEKLRQLKAKNQSGQA